MESTSLVINCSLPRLPAISRSARAFSSTLSRLRASSHAQGGPKSGPMGEHFTPRPHRVVGQMQPAADDGGQPRERESPASRAKRARVRGSSGRPRFVPSESSAIPRRTLASTRKQSRSLIASRDCFRSKGRASSRRTSCSLAAAIDKGADRPARPTKPQFIQIGLMRRQGACSAGRAAAWRACRIERSMW